ncbi:hypothetical protein LTS18_000792, partial [Coniosporium uncinatum]
MAPGAKRKRGDRTYSQDSNDGSGRPSPHRPQSLNLAQQNQSYNSRGGGGSRRSSRGGRGGSHGPQSPVSGSNEQPVVATESPITSSAMSPPSTNTGAQRPTPTPNVPSRPETPVDRPVSRAPDPPPKPTEPPAYFFYEYLTNERVTAWKTSGKQELVNAVVQAGSVDNTEPYTTVFQELVTAGLDRKLELSEAGRIVKDIIQAASSDDSLGLSQLFLDYISILTEGDLNGKQLEAFGQQLRPMILETGITPQLMRKEMDSNILASLGLVRSIFPKKAIRNTTNITYRMQNYNLLREETEGYSKLITEMFGTVNGQQISAEDMPEVFEKVKGLIGAFDLEPGRVLDVILDVF